MTYPKVWVQWEDSFLATTEAWTPISDIDFLDGARVVNTVGFELVGLLEGHHVIALSYDEAADSVGPTKVIPEGMVRSRTVLEGVK